MRGKLWMRTGWVRILAPPLISSVTLGMLNFAVSQFPHLWVK